MNMSGRLNMQQRRAAESGEGPVLIVAGPGTGKTKTLTARIAYVLTVEGAKPDEIVALTFTNKAAREMRERLSRLLGEEAKLPKVTTFHAFGHDILQQAGRAQALLTESQRQEIIRALVKPPSLKSNGGRELGLLISRLKTSLEAAPDRSEQELLAGYGRALHERQMQDFDDLLVEAVELLGAGKAPQYAHVLVDEFQDTSELQYEMLKLLAAGQNIFAIGDPNQSIYAFRGAGGSMFDRFRNDFPGVTDIALTSNYRSRPEIVALANAVFPDSPRLVARTSGTAAVRAVRTLNDYSEAAYILQEIERGIGGSDLITGNSEEFVREPRDYAVLYRTHRSAKTLQETFAAGGLPCQIAGEGSPYDYPDVQAIIALMRHLHEPARVGLPKLKHRSENQVRAAVGKLIASDKLNPMPVCEYVPYFADAFGLAYGRQLQQLQGVLVQFGSDIGAALRHIDDLAEREFYDPTVNAVTLLTIHAAKGLEFGHVFVIAAEEGVLPKLDAKARGDIDEERRLFYVAVTRAKDTLELLHTKTRSGKPAEVSHFIGELPAAVLPRVDDPSLPILEKRLRKRAAKRAQISLF